MLILSILKGRGKRKVPQRNLRPVDMGQRLIDERYSGFYLLENGDIVEIHDYEGIWDDEEYRAFQEKDPPGTRIEGGVYFTDQYGDGGVMLYTGDDTLKDLDESGFLNAEIKGLLTDSGDSYDEMETVFFDYLIDEKERDRKLRDVISRFGLMNRRCRR